MLKTILPSLPWAVIIIIIIIIIAAEGVEFLREFIALVDLVVTCAVLQEVNLNDSPAGDASCTDNVPVQSASNSVPPRLGL